MNLNCESVAQPVEDRQTEETFSPLNDQCFHIQHVKMSFSPLLLQFSNRIIQSLPVAMKTSKRQKEKDSKRDSSPGPSRHVSFSYFQPRFHHIIMITTKTVGLLLLTHGLLAWHLQCPGHNYPLTSRGQERPSTVNWQHPDFYIREVGNHFTLLFSFFFSS